MLVSAVWIWPAVLGVVEDIGQARLNGWEPASAGQLIWGAGDWLAYALVTPAIFWISSRWPIVRPHLVRRFLVHFGWALLFCLVWAIVGKLLQLAIMWIVSPEQVRQAIAGAGTNLGRQVGVNVASWILTTLPFGVVVYTTVAGMAHAIAWFDEARRHEVQVARMTEQLATARFAALQAQVNPHFLFNTLNTINVLVRDGDRSGAVRIVEQLSDVLRRTLSRHQANEVPLGDELDLVSQYLAIEQARFSDRLRPLVDVPDEMRAAAVPSFAVQHLVENAIRHGIARREDAGQVTITARREGEVLEVSVADDGPGIGASAALPGHGLDNTRQRLDALHAGRASLEVTALRPVGTVATLRVPYREITLEARDAG
jgi:signal transduction histidine kinase